MSPEPARKHLILLVADKNMEASLEGLLSRFPALRSWLREQGLLATGAVKPARPKEAVERALFTARKPRSSSIYAELARSVGTERCTDPAFLKLKRCLQEWFPPGRPES